MASKLPLIILAGRAGSGKDALGSLLAKNGNGTTIAQADAMKRFVLANFDVNPEDLWGPSERRQNRLSTALKNEVWTTRGEAGELLDQLTLARVEQWYQTHIWHIHERKVTVRHLLQTFGTELGRSYKLDFWNDIAIKNAMAVLNEGRIYNSRTGLSSDGGHWAGSELVVITDGRFRNEVLNVKKYNGSAIKIFSIDEVNGTTPPATHPSELELANIPSWWYDYVVFNRKDGLDKLNEQAIRVLMHINNEFLPKSP